MKIKRAAFSALLFSLTLALAGCSAVSLNGLVEECGGKAAGIAGDDRAIAVDASSDGLTCVIRGVFSDKAQQYAVALAVDDGPNQQLLIDGREVKVVNLGGSTVLVISAK